VGEAGGVNGGEPLDEAAFAVQCVVDGARREVGELVVVTLIAEVSGVLGVVEQPVLPDVVEEACEVV
jgi:hypothetical protein